MPRCLSREGGATEPERHPLELRLVAEPQPRDPGLVLDHGDPVVRADLPAAGGIGTRPSRRAPLGRARSHFRIRHRGAKLLSESGMKRMSGSTQRQYDRALRSGTLSFEPYRAHTCQSFPAPPAPLQRPAGPPQYGSPKTCVLFGWQPPYDSPGHARCMSAI